MAEELSKYYGELGIKVRYMHSDIDAIERNHLIRSLRLGEFDVLIGINLLREGLDLPEVSLIAIMDADKEGFLRSETSLIQTMGRAARNVNGKVILYAKKITGSMQRAFDITDYHLKLRITFAIFADIDKQIVANSPRSRNGKTRDNSQNRSKRHRRDKT